METRNAAGPSPTRPRVDRSALEHVAPAQACCDDRWEEAYLRFETPEQEVAKFRRRLARMGAGGWPRDAAIVELFCGRGNGLIALQQLGFTRLEGVDLSATLLERRQVAAKCYVGDCRNLHFEDQSRDILIVQGGLHHLPDLPDDLERTIAEAVRVLKPGGRFVLVEPWQTPFLRFARAVSENPVARRLWSRLDALAVMIEQERPTYEAWLGQPRMILGLLESRFDVELRSIGRGMLCFVGRKRSNSTGQ